MSETPIPREQFGVHLRNLFELSFECLNGAPDTTVSERPQRLWNRAQVKRSSSWDAKEGPVRMFFFLEERYPSPREGSASETAMKLKRVALYEQDDRRYVETWQFDTCNDVVYLLEIFDITTGYKLGSITSVANTQQQPPIMQEAADILDSRLMDLIPINEHPVFRSHPLEQPFDEATNEDTTGDSRE